MITEKKSKKFCNFLNYIKNEVVPKKKYIIEIQINTNNSLLMITKNFIYLISYNKKNTSYWSIYSPKCEKFILLSNIENVFEKIITLIDNHENKLENKTEVSIF